MVWWIRDFFCCWLDLLEGRACMLYNCIFCPCVLTIWACNIYLCECATLYFRRSCVYVCCCCCRTMNCCWMFTDKKFPPNDNSLGEIGGDTAKATVTSLANVTWLRAGRFTFAGKMQLFGPTVDSRDICQGVLGDCWLLAAMACLAEHRGAIHALFRSKERDPRGRYKLRLYDGAKERWRNIVIDDYIPCDAEKLKKHGECKPLFTQPNGNELWVVLLEKAFAKFCGSYASLEGGQTIWALRAMTGDPARWFEKEAYGESWKRMDLINIDDPIDRRKCGLRAKEENIGHDMMFKTLQMYDELKSVLCASGASGECGLHKGHAYSILEVKAVKNVRLIQIRNPWGSGEWKGDWSDKSDMWAKHPDVKKAVGYENLNDGAFWMSWEDFAKHWCRIGVVDRTVDIHTVKLEVDDDTNCAPTYGCCKGCCRFWCCCLGCRRLYCPHRSSEETVKVSSWRCEIL